MAGLQDSGKWLTSFLTLEVQSPTAVRCSQLMHCQETEYKTGAMALEEELGLLMGASSHLRAGGAAVTVHSLRPSPGYLALQGALPLPPPDSPPQPNQHGSQVGLAACVAFQQAVLPSSVTAAWRGSP